MTTFKAWYRQKNLLDICLDGKALDVARPWCGRWTVVPEYAVALAVLDELRRSQIQQGAGGRRVRHHRGSGDRSRSDGGDCRLARPRWATRRRTASSPGGDGSWLVEDGELAANLVAERLGCRMLASGGDYETVAGFLLGPRPYPGEDRRRDCGGWLAL